MMPAAFLYVSRSHHDAVGATDSGVNLSGQSADALLGSRPISHIASDAGFLRNVSKKNNGNSYDLVCKLTGLTVMLKYQGGNDIFC